jgi:uncharacterized circularly permuted ATP-grasp superfamily protein/uncharacterized alpha-E superfamily protein
VIAGEPKRETAAGRQAPSLLSGYRPIAGAADEMIDAHGKVRPAWDMLVAALSEIATKERSERFARADQYLRDAGVYYRVYEGQGAREREWPLAHIPLIISEPEWQTISAGIEERADLLERIVADIYGANMLVARGLLPPALVAGNPEFLRPLVGTRPVGGHFLHFCAFELGRGPDGRWWVLGDRTQAPSGAGFALENRVATTRALSDVFADMNVHRLAGFFRQFRDTLASLASSPSGRVAILSPGPLNETYFEHAWIARYLGISLLEGEDLRVADGNVMVRTVSGLKPVSVLWRRMDAAFMDPLELKGDSQIGTPGMVEALRRGQIAIVNALGSGIVETRALLAFFPAIARALNGSDPKLPSVATWWCGQEREQRHVMDNLDALVVGPALSTRLPFEDPEATRLGSSLDASGRAALLSALAENGAGYAAQEAVTLSTTPVYSHGRLVPRPMSLRVFAARTAQGWTVMPGGFARIGQSNDPTAITMQRGGQAADVWIVGDGPVKQETLLGDDAGPTARYRGGNLPSRAAENMLWLGRYAERLEGTVRILRAYHIRLAEAADPAIPVLKRIRAYLDFLGVDAACPVSAGLLRSIDHATSSAGHIRDRFSPDGWLALSDLSKTLHRFADRVEPGDDAARAMTVVLRKLAGFSGLVHENMYRFTGWRFLEIGRRIERGIHMARILGALGTTDAPEGGLDMLLEIGDSVLTHRRQFSVSATRRSVLDLLALDPLNPRSIAFQLDRLKTSVSELPGNEAGHLSPAAKEVLHIHTRLSICEAKDLDNKRFDEIVASLGAVSDSLSRNYFV